MDIFPSSAPVEEHHDIQNVALKLSENNTLELCRLVPLRFSNSYFGFPSSRGYLASNSDDQISEAELAYYTDSAMLHLYKSSGDAHSQARSRSAIACINDVALRYLCNVQGIRRACFVCAESCVG